MDNIINKLNDLKNKKVNDIWYDWSLEEKKDLIYLYYIISKNEHHIFNLVYDFHGCDSWKDMFVDFNAIYLTDKANGVKIALNNINQEINQEINENNNS